MQMSHHCILTRMDKRKKTGNTMCNMIVNNWIFLSWWKNSKFIHFGKLSDNSTKAENMYTPSANDSMLRYIPQRNVHICPPEDIY